VKIAVAGMTHLGVCMSIAAHEWGLAVVGFDTNAERVAAIGRADFDAAEPGVVEFLRVASDRYVVTDDLTLAAEADLVLIAVDTRLDANGDNDDSEVVALLEVIASAVPASTPIVIASQVRPGFTRAHRYLHGELYYFMETLIFGRGLERAQHPERYMVGRADPDVALPQVLQDFLSIPDCPLFLMSYESAELTKLAANYILSASITAANSLADLAPRLGANWREMEPALRADQRIGEKSYISAGLGIGGANLIRDLHGIKEMADRLGADSRMASLMIDHSSYMRHWVLRTMNSIRQEVDLRQMAILGLAYKPGTESTRGSAGMDLIDVFEHSLHLVIHDPAVRLADRPAGSKVVSVSRAMSALAGSQAVAITTPWPEYAGIVSGFLDSCGQVVVVDPYRMIDKSRIRNPLVRVLQIGVANV
jgi:UDPglucose 6-dehydrogenase